MKVDYSSHATVLKEMMMLLLVGFHCILRFHMVKVNSHEIVVRDYALDEGAIGIVHDHSIKTVLNAYGDIFDCVAIHKQPALNHPLLKDHTIQMGPSSLPRGNSEEAASGTSFSEIKFLNEVCPMRTVPIMRPKETVDSSPPPNDSLIKDIVHQESVVKPLVSYEAQLRMKSNSYYGAQADLNVYGIPQVSANQLSSSIVWVLNDGDGTGPIEKVNGIMAGWLVHPSLYGDNNTHLFINWTVDGFQNTGCYNHLCPGFVQVNPEIPPGGALSPLSVYDGPQYAVRILIYREPKTGDWWLVFGKDQQVVGYWPNSLFNSLNDFATKVYFGGLVRCPMDESSPPMGSGHFPEEGLSRACYSANLNLVNGSNFYTRVSAEMVEFYHSNPRCYNVGDLLNMQAGGQGFLFGGPGNCALMI